MAGKVKSLYVCSECGYETAKWLGKCPSCGEWNTLNEEIRETTKSGVVKPEKRMSSSYSKPLRINEISTDDEQRYFTGSKACRRHFSYYMCILSLSMLYVKYTCHNFR